MAQTQFGVAFANVYDRDRSARNIGRRTAPVF
jgi:hypothetical protein